MFLRLGAGQTDARSGAIEVKIKKLDGELTRYKEQMSKLRNGPGKVRSYRRLSAWCTTLSALRRVGSNPATGDAHAEAEAHV
jgi:hypothetical protein